MSGTKDNILELIENIEKEYNYVIGIIKPGTSSNEEKIEIYTNTSENGLDKLLKVLKEYKKSLQIKPKTDSIKEVKNDNPNI